MYDDRKKIDWIFDRKIFQILIDKTSLLSQLCYCLIHNFFHENIHKSISYSRNKFNHYFVVTTMTILFLQILHKNIYYLFYQNIFFIKHVSNEIFYILQEKKKTNNKHK